MEYLTWRKLREELNQVQDDKVLDEPALFAHMDIYGSETLMPMQLIQDTWHPDDQPRTVTYSESDEAFSRLNDSDDDDNVPVRKLPHGALLLSYGGLDEDLDETKEWLTKRHPVAGGKPENEKMDTRTEKEIGNIGNYYGGLWAKAEGGKYYWGIENYDELATWEEISKDLYDQLMSHRRKTLRKNKVAAQ